MRVCIFSETRLWGGLEVHSVALASVLAARGDDVVIACLGEQTFEVYRRHVPASIRLLLVNLPARRGLIGWWRALRHVHADSALLQKGTLATGGLALDVVLRVRYRRFVAVMHLEPPPLPPRSRGRHLGGLLPGLGLWWYRWRLQGFARSLAPTMTVCVSDAVRRCLKDDYGFPARKLLTIHNGIDRTAFETQPLRRQSAREAWGIPSDAFVFGSVGRLSDQKALDVAVKAFAEVIRARPDVRAYLVCVGEGAERERILRVALELDVADRVKLPGFSRAPADAYQGIDVFLIPSRYEGLPFALVEAMASGCLVVGSHVGGIPEVITEPRLGWLVPPENPGLLAQAMLAVLNLSDEERAARIRAGRERVTEAFDVRVQCLKFVPLLDPSQPTRTSTTDETVTARS